MYAALGERRAPSQGRASRAGGLRPLRMPQMRKDTAHVHDDTSVPWEARSAWYELRPFRGMWADVRRRLPYYLSDWTDALRGNSLPIVAASVVQIFFINLMPAIAYVLDMYDRTDGSYGVNEVILASALAASTQHPSDRVPAAITFVVAASGVAVAGIGSAFWGVVAGALALAVQHWRPAR